MSFMIFTPFYTATISSIELGLRESDLYEIILLSLCSLFVTRVMPNLVSDGYLHIDIYPSGE